eukprot:147575-Amorphochlora_amoeboformis.AAC.1
METEGRVFRGSGLEHGYIMSRDGMQMRSIYDAHWVILASDVNLRTGRILSRILYSSTDPLSNRRMASPRKIVMVSKGAGTM